MSCSMLLHPQLLITTSTLRLRYHQARHLHYQVRPRQTPPTPPSPPSPQPAMTHSPPATPPEEPPLPFPTHTPTSSFTTGILKVDPSSIHFTPSSSSPTAHPYDSPTLNITCATTESNLLYASHLLRDAHHAIAFPTETVYGLAADATNTTAVQRIFEAKNRPQDNPLIVHISSLHQLRKILNHQENTAPTTNTTPPVDIPEIYLPLITKFWPGPLTILLPLPPSATLSPSVTALQSTFAVRLPNHPIALALAHISSTPLAAPSANTSGKPSPTTSSHVFTDLQGRIPLILDGGPSSVGLESTVVTGLCDPPRILRPGGVTLEQIRGCGGAWRRCVAGSEGLKKIVVENGVAENGSGQVDGNGEHVPLVPGMKYRHYSPRAKVVLYEPGAGQPNLTTLVSSGVKIGIVRTRAWEKVDRWESWKGKGGVAPQVEDIWLGKSGEDISRGLFAALRELDDRDVGVIYVEGIGEEDEGLAVMNRLRKAASEVVKG